MILFVVMTAFEMIVVVVVVLLLLLLLSLLIPNRNQNRVSNRLLLLLVLPELQLMMMLNSLFLHFEYLFNIYKNIFKFNSFFNDYIIVYAKL